MGVAAFRRLQRLARRRYWWRYAGIQAVSVNVNRGGGFVVARLIEIVFFATGAATGYYGWYARFLAESRFIGTHALGIRSLAFWE